MYGFWLCLSGQISNEGIKTLDEIAKMLPSTLMGKVDSFGNLNAVVHGKTMSQGVCMYTCITMYVYMYHYVCMIVWLVNIWVS